MRALFASPVGFLIGLSLGALGGGGSILAVPALVYVAGEGAKAATTTSLVIVGVVSLWGMVRHWRRGRVRTVPGVLFGLAGVGGSLLGSRLNRAADPDLLLLAFSGVMLVAGWRMWASNRSAVPSRVAVTAGDGAHSVDTLPPPTTPPGITVSFDVVVKVVVAGSAVGLITGFFGVGGGFVIVPALVLVLGFDMPAAVGTSLLVIAINSAVALASRLAATGVEWHVALPFTVAGIVGASVGGHLAERVPGSTLVRWFVTLLVAVAVYTAVRSSVALFG